MAKPKQLKVTLLKSRFGRLKKHRACVAGLGFAQDTAECNGPGYSGEPRHD